MRSGAKYSRRNWKKQLHMRMAICYRVYAERTEYISTLARRYSHWRFSTIIILVRREGRLRSEEALPRSVSVFPHLSILTTTHRLLDCYAEASARTRSERALFGQAYFARHSSYWHSMLGCDFGFGQGLVRYPAAPPANNQSARKPLPRITVQQY